MGFATEDRIRVRLIAVVASDRLLADVGAMAWVRSGAVLVEQALPQSLYRITRPIVVRGGDQEEIEQLLRDWCDAPQRRIRAAT